MRGGKHTAGTQRVLDQMKKKKLDEQEALEKKILACCKVYTKANIDGAVKRLYVHKKDYSKQ